MGETDGQGLARRALVRAAHFRDQMVLAGPMEGEAWEELTAFDGIGVVVAEAITEFFGEKHNRDGSTIC